MKKKSGDNWSIDEWDESLDVGKTKKASDPFYGPLDISSYKEDDNWCVSAGNSDSANQSANISSQKHGNGSKKISASSAKRLSIILFSAAVLLLVGGINLLNNRDPGNPGDQSGDIPLSVPVSTPATPELETIEPATPEPVSLLADNEWYGPELRYYYQQLSPHEQQVFEQLYNGIANCEKKIPISSTSTEEFDRIMVALQLDCPEFFHINGGTIWSSQFITDYEPVYRIDQAAYRSTCAQIHQVIDQIKAELPAVAGDYEKAKTAHYWMIDNCEYLSAGDDSTAEADACLIYGRSQCSGYAAAQTLIMRTMGVNCLVVVSETHEWNIIRINSRWYQNDATWDDGDYQWFPNGNRYAGWFNVPDKLVIDTDHRQKSQQGFTTPACNSIQDNYSYREGIYVQKGTSNPARYIADSLRKAQAAGKYSVNILIDDKDICTKWDDVLDSIYCENYLYDWAFYPPGNTQTAYAIITEKAAQ